jgi:hypothetical protein
MPGDRIVNVKHPSPMLLRRKRKRSREHWFVATHTPVTLRSGSREDLGDTHRIPTEHGDLTWRTYEGSLWLQVSGVHLASYVPRPWDRFDVSRFEEYLAGAALPHTPAYTDLGHAVRRTPLAAVAHNAHEATRGSPLTEGDRLLAGLEVAEITEDGRPAAAEDLRRFMDERVRVVGELVLLRAYDPLVKLGSKGLAFQPFPQVRRASYLSANLDDPLGYRPDAYEEGLAWEDGRSWNGRPIGIGPWAGSFAGAPYGADTARLLAGFSATAALGAFSELRDRYGYFLFDRANASAVELLPGYADAVRVWAEKACLGRIGAVEAEAAVEAARRLTEVVADCYGVHAAGSETVREARSLVRRFLEFEWPRVVPSDVPDVDVEALEGLAM